MQIVDLGLLPYDEGHRIQKDFVRRVQQDPSAGFLLLVEHSAVYTLGRFASEKNLLEDRGIPVRRVERGGDITYHGPGQLVGYVILDLFRRGLTVRALVNRIEEALIGVSRDRGVDAGRRDKCPGIWVQDRKLGSLGLALSRRVTYHGFALNVNTDLAPFGWINPCGMPRCRMTSLQQELGFELDLEAIKKDLARNFETAGARAQRTYPKTLSGFGKSYPPSPPEPGGFGG